MNSGDGIDYHQRFSENIGDLIEVKLFKDQMLLPPHKKNSKTYWLAKSRISSSENIAACCLVWGPVSKSAKCQKWQPNWRDNYCRTPLSWWSAEEALMLLSTLSTSKTMIFLIIKIEESFNVLLISHIYYSPMHDSTVIVGTWSRHTSPVCWGNRRAYFVPGHRFIWWC